MAGKIVYSIFTKPWGALTLDELAGLIAEIGADGVEFPLRDGFQVEPGNAERDLPKLVRALGKRSLKVYSVASSPVERVFAACAESGVPLIRIMLGHDLAGDYLETEKDMRRQIERFLPLCERYGVKVGVQQHCGPGVNNSMELLHLLGGYDPKLVGGVWDAAHSGLAGEEPEQAIDIIWSHLALVNFKNATYIRANGPEAALARYDRHFTTGSQGLCSWERAVSHLKKRGYTGNICMPAEYTDIDNTVSYIKQDLKYLKRLVGDY